MYVTHTCLDTDKVPGSRLPGSFFLRMDSAFSQDHMYTYTFDIIVLPTIYVST